MAYQPNQTNGLTPSDSERIEIEATLAQLPGRATLDAIAQEIEAAGGEWAEPPEYQDSVGRTMFDLPTSKNNVVSVLLPRDTIEKVPAQSLVRILSLPDRREYQGIVVEGPFHDPDGLRADAPIIVTTTVRGMTFMPRYHGRVQVEIIGEIDGKGEDRVILPPKFRPLPNSPVFPLDAAETAEALRVEGDIRLGLAIGHDDIEVHLPATSKAVYPRHVGFLGTTGSGKSTTVSGQIAEFQRVGFATIVLDTEGEYTQINEPTVDRTMLKAIDRFEARGRSGLEPHGVPNTHIYHLVGRDTTNPAHPSRTAFSLQFSQLSPYAVTEILEMTDAQQERYLKAYEIAREALQTLQLLTDEQRDALTELDEMESAVPGLTLEMMYDIVRLCADTVAKTKEEETGARPLRSAQLRPHRSRLVEMIKAAQLVTSVPSWRKVQGQLGRLLRLRIFDNPQAPALDFELLTQPGRVSIVDLGDTDSPQINNLVIAQILRGIQRQQESNYEAATQHGTPPRRVMVVVEEAHEFLSAERIKQMPVLFQQVARIARRGRKRWLGLAFVTQLPQHLPDEVLGLINTYVLHKIADANVVSRLKRSIGGIDDALWGRLPNLAPGQAIVSAPSLARPLLVAIDPTPCRLRMVD